MAIAVSFSTESDFHRIFTIMSDAFADDHPGMEVLYPKHKTPLGRVQGAERLLHMKRTDAANRFLKATDTVTGEIIGHAKWIVFEDGMPEETPLAGDYWGSEDDKEYAKCVYEGLMDPVRRVIQSAEGPVVGLFIWFFFLTSLSCLYCWTESLGGCLKLTLSIISIQCLIS